MKNTKQALERAKARAEAAICGAASSRTADEWLQPSREAEKKAKARERLWLRTVLANHGWRPSDMAAVLAELMEGRFIESLMDTPIFQKAFIARVNEPMKRLEEEHFGIQFGMFLHFEMPMTMPNILRLTQAASKTYNCELDRYESKVLYFDRFEGYAGRRVLVPRVAPPRGKLEKVIRSIEGTLNVQVAEDGRLSFVLFQDLLIDVLLKDLGKLGAPPLVEF
jgi:hypothetical protein